MLEKKFFSKNQNLIIFLIVAFLAIQGFAMIEIYKINFPYAYDMTSMRIFLDYMYTNDDYTVNDFFQILISDQNSRGIIFPKLIITPNYLLNNFDSGNIFYLNWIIVSLTLTMFFLLLKNNNNKLYWTLIPISAFLYSPLINNNYWNYTITIWYITGFALVGAVYLLSKKLGTKTTMGAVGFSLLATYSIPLGLPVWIVGSIVMLRAFIKNKFKSLKILLLYFSSMIIIGIIYYSGNIDSQAIISYNDLISLNSLSVFFTYLAVPFKLKFSELMVFVGILSFSFSLVVVFYLGIIRKKISELFPWILFLIIGSVSGIMVRFGRFDPYFEGNLPYYSPIAELFQIGLCFLVGVLILDLKQQTKFNRKNLILLLLYSIIILQIIFLIPSYYNGWWKADYYYNEKLEYIECFSLHHGLEKCQKIYDMSLDQNNEEYNIFRILNYFIQNKSNIFSETPNLNDNIKNDLDEFSKIIDDKPDIISGQINSINLQNMLTEKSVVLEDESLIISGIINHGNKQTINATYLLINSIPIAKFTDFENVELINSKKQSSQTYWTFAVMKGYLPLGCNEITIGGLVDNKPFVINTVKEICI